MNYNNFLKQISNGQLQRVYLFIGEEEYLMKDAIARLKEKYIDKNFETLNYISLNGKETDIDSLVNACETLPFMNEKKLVILEDINIFIENMEDKRMDELYKYIENLGDFLILILADNENSLKKNRKIYKIFKNNDSYVDFSHLAGRDLNNWINSILKTHNRKISPSNMEYFISESSYNSRNIDINLYDMENQILQIIDHKKEETIVRESIDEVLIRSIDTNIFELLDAINSFDSGKSLYIFNQMYMDNEPVLKILFMIIRQVRLILGIKLYREKSYGDKDIQEKLGIKPYEYRKISGLVSRFTISGLKTTLEDLLDADRKIKSTSIDDKLIMEILLVNLTTKVEKKQNFG